MIKFRGVPLEDVSEMRCVNFDGDFVYGYYVKNGDGALIVGDKTKELDDVGLSRWYADVDPKTVEQFTGLTDVNGNEIYEGDIIKSSYKYAQPKVSQIIIENGNSYILGECLATGNEMLVSDHISEIKVIGNVHTNHELLEEKK
ncbi:prophage P2a protein 26 [Lactiplantibacillus plantarum]|nr:prophage P2a protein 26 [Lactiplantibacillus plantarum]MCG0880340.1 prophage P2a protein 26 [Lactiplantibacillus plantarum]